MEKQLDYEFHVTGSEFALCGLDAVYLLERTDCRTFTISNNHYEIVNNVWQAYCCLKRVFRQICEIYSITTNESIVSTYIYIYVCYVILMRN